jgi:hypothetical protein
MTNRPNKRHGIKTAKSKSKNTIHVKKCDCGMWDAETGEPVFLTNNVSEMLEFHITSYKQDGYLPNNFRLSDSARKYLKDEASNILKLGRKIYDEEAVMEILEHTIFGFCMGYHINGSD